MNFILPLCLAATLGANTFDAYTTHLGLSTGHAVEANPLMNWGPPPVKYVVKAATTGMEVASVTYLWKHQEHKSAIILTLAIVALNGAVGAHNLHVYHQVKRH